MILFYAVTVVVIIALVIAPFYFFFYGILTRQFDISAGALVTLLIWAGIYSLL